MKIIHNDIIERDIDYSLISSIINNKEIESFILSKVNEKGKLKEVYHSLIQTQTSGGVGESDIVLIYKDMNGEYFGIFIEDKINADPQENQRIRYNDRADQLKKSGKINRYYVILCAPNKYLSTYKSEGYEITISFEDIIPYLTDELTKSIFEYALIEKSSGYNPVKDEIKTQFWDYLYNYVESKYSLLHLNRNNGPRGSKAVWPIFKTYITGLSIVYKSDKDSIDLEFSNMANRNEEVLNLLKDFNINGYVLINTGKSLSLHYEIPKSRHVSFDEDFNNQINNLDYVLNEILKLDEIANKLTFKGIDKFPLKNN